jgi:hypothetical protein
MQPYLHAMIDSERVLTHIAHMKWFVLDAWGANDRLLTSDRPVMMTNGLVGPAAHIVMPISPTLLFLATNNEETHRKIGRLNRNQMANINNQGVSEQAKRFVYGFSNTLRAFISMHLGKQVPCTPFDRM